MIGALMIAAAVAAGLAWWRVLLLGVVLVAPIAAMSAIGLTLWRARPADDVSAALFCEGVSSELQAGATLHQALASGAAAAGIKSTVESGSLEELAEQLAAVFDEIGDELQLAVLTAARAGSGAAQVFEELSTLALAQSEIEREVRMATAPGRATALVLVGVPVFFVVTRLASGGLAPLLSTAQQRLVALAGLGLFLVGLTIASAVLWRAQR